MEPFHSAHEVPGWGQESGGKTSVGEAHYLISGFGAHLGTRISGSRVSSC